MNCSTDEVKWLSKMVRVMKYVTVKTWATRDPKEMI